MKVKLLKKTYEVMWSGTFVFPFQHLKGFTNENNEEEENFQKSLTWVRRARFPQMPNASL